MANHSPVVVQAMRACVFLELICATCGKVRSASDSMLDSRSVPLLCPSCGETCTEWELKGFGATHKPLPFFQVIPDPLKCSGAKALRVRNF